MTVTLELPWPPSVNDYWHRNPTTGFFHINRRGREYREEVIYLVRAQLKAPPPRWKGPVSVSIDAHPPDKRARDLDNLLKATLDALEHAGLYESDSQIDSICIKRQARHKGGKLFVSAEGQ